jgi:hypothetical protein
MSDCRIREAVSMTETSSGIANWHIPSQTGMPGSMPQIRAGLLYPESRHFSAQHDLCAT